MSSARFLLALSIAVVFITSCTDSGTLTTPTDMPAPGFDPNKAPPTSGPNVVRGLPLGFILGSDPESELVLEAGFEEPFTASNCSDLSTFPLSLTQQGVFSPSGHIHFTTVPQKVSVDVFRIGGSITDACQLVGAPLVATGTATFAGTEKYLTDGGSGASTVNIIVHGILELTGGGRARVRASVHVLVRPDGSLVHDMERITLAPL